MKALLLIGLLLIDILSACNAFNPNSLSEADKQGIVGAFSQYLATRHLISNEPCTNTLTLGHARVTDSTINGNNGAVIIQVPVTVSDRMNPQAAGMLGDCFGAPSGGLTRGMSFTSSWRVGIERWQSGWRVQLGIGIAPTRATVTHVPPPIPQLRFIVVNNSGNQVQVIRGRPVGTNVWGENLIRSFLWAGERSQYSLDNPSGSCAWDLEITYHTHQQILLNERNLCANSVVLLSPSTQQRQAARRQSFSVVNTAGHIVVTINVSPTTENEWGDDILGRNALRTGQTAQVVFDRAESQCNYDIRVTYDDSHTSEMRNINLCQVATVQLVDQ